MGAISQRRKWWATGVVAVLVVGGGTWWWWPRAEPPRARVYAEDTVCLLTDAQGINGPQAAEVWRVIEEEALVKLVQAEFVTVSGAQTTDNARTYLNGMAQGHCDLLFAVGSAQVAAVEAGAAQFPSVRFYTIGGAAEADNLLRVTGDTAVSVREIIKGMARTS